MQNESIFNRLFIKVKHLLPYFFIALIAFSIYAKTVNYGVVDLDDTIFIHTCAKNYDSPSAFKNAFKHDAYWGYWGTKELLFYRPMLAVSFIIDHKIAGGSENFAHLTNVLLHVISSISVLFFFRRCLSFDRKLSFLAAVFFAVHPITVQTVAWIPGRNDSLFFIYFIICLICFIEYLRSEKPVFLLAHVIFLLFCLFTKESAVTVPLILFLYYITHRDTHKSSLKIYIYIIWVLCLAIFLFARKTVLFDTNYSWHFEFGKQINIAAFFDHISAIFFLRSPMSEHKETKIFVLGIISVLISLFMAFYKKDKNSVKEISFYVLLPVILLLPNFISGNDKLSRVIFQGNRMYIPLFAYSVIIFSFCKNFIRTPEYKKILYAIFLSVILISSAITLKSSSYLKNAMTFWDRIISENREISIYVIIDYINTLLKNNQIDKAFAYASHYAKESNYEHLELLYQLGKIYLFTEDYENASKYFEIVYSRNSKKRLDLYLLNYLSSVRANNKEKSAYYYNIILEFTNLTPEEFDEQFIIYGRQFDKAIEEIKRQ